MLIWTLASSTLYVLSSEGTKKSTFTSEIDELILVYEAEITVADSVIGYYVRIASTTCYIFCSGWTILILVSKAVTGWLSTIIVAFAILETNGSTGSNVALSSCSISLITFSIVED